MEPRAVDSWKMESSEVQFVIDTGGNSNYAATRDAQTVSKIMAFV